jgi:hypothetical protein
MGYYILDPDLAWALSIPAEPEISHLFSFHPSRHSHPESVVCTFLPGFTDDVCRPSWDDIISEHFNINNLKLIIPDDREPQIIP